MDREDELIKEFSHLLYIFRTNEGGKKGNKVERESICRRKTWGEKDKINKGWIFQVVIYPLVLIRAEV